MRICFLINNLTARAGSERAQINLANALADCGDHVSIWSCYWKGRSPGFSLSNQVSVRHGLRNPAPYFLDYPWLMIRFALYVLSKRPDWIVCTDTNRVIVALLVMFLPGIRMAVWEHFALSHSVTKKRGRLARRLAARYASAIVTLTACDAEAFKKDFKPIGRVTAIPNILRVPPLQDCERQKEILAIGRLTRQKGFDLLLDAWAHAHTQLPDWTLHIVGQGELHKELLGIASRLGIEDRVRFNGFVKDPYPLYSRCGMFVLSSRFEGLPFVLIEAMACGAPCISFDCPTGPGELIQSGANGLLIPPEGIEAFAEGMVKLGRDSRLRKQFGDAARAVSEEFSETRIVARWKEFLALKSAASA